MEASTGRAIAIMLGQVKDQSVARDLHEKRGFRFVAMFPIKMKARVVEVIFAGLLNGKDTQNRDDAKGAWRHPSIIVLNSRSV